MSPQGAMTAAIRRPLTADERRYYREWWVTATVTLATITLFTVMQWGQSFGFVIYDQFQRWWPATPANDIVVIAVDDNTIEARGGWPLKRTDYAELLAKLADSGNHPKAIGFDILFPDPMPADHLLAEQIQRHKVFLAVEQPRSVASGFTPVRQINPVLAKAATGLAHVNLSFERDGSLRGSHLLNNGLPQLTLAMSGKPQQTYASHGSYRRIHLVDPQVGFPTASLADVLSGQVPLQFFKDKYVLIGSTAPSLGDHFPTMYSGEQEAGTPGVMLHANLLNDILRDQLIEPVPMWAQVALSCLSLAFALGALLVLSPLTELLVNLWVALSTMLVSFCILMLSRCWFDPGLCIIAIALLKPAWAWRRNEMIVNFMAERAAKLENVQRKRKKLRQGLQLRHFTSDTLLQYSRLLDNAIAMVNGRLQFLQRVVSQIPTAMLVADSDGRTLLMNPRMQQDLPAGLVQQGQSLEPLMSHLGLLTLNLEMLSEKDHLVSGQDPRGGLRHFIFRVAQIPQEGDKPLWVLSLADVTEMRQFQAQRDRTLQLLSHDMRTPIASIIALSRKPIPDTDSATESASYIQRHARTLLSMMDDFIFSIHAQAPQYTLVELLIDTLVDEAVGQVKDLAHGEQMQLLQEFEEVPQFVMADQRLLTRVLVNLLVNAIRYGAKGSSIRVAVSHDGVDHPQPYVRCIVTNVVGEYLSNPSQDLSTGKSFGLGLNFVQTVVQKHNGQLHTNLPKTPGALAVVELALPLVK
jgi:CHASE2 domain-containing sensor protein/nitrogen-specific signal transduction histidine kinase